MNAVGRALRAASWLLVPLVIGTLVGALLKPPSTVERNLNEVQVVIEHVEVAPESCLRAVRQQGEIIQLLGTMNGAMERAARATDPDQELTILRDEVNPIRKQLRDRSRGAGRHFRDCQTEAAVDE